MTKHPIEDSHDVWLHDIDYRKEYGAETAKLNMATALATARKKTGITQAELAELAGVSQAYIAKLERGDANPSIGNIGRLLACLWVKPLISVSDMKPTDSFTRFSVGGDVVMEPHECLQTDSIGSRIESH